MEHAIISGMLLKDYLEERDEAEAMIHSLNESLKKCRKALKDIGEMVDAEATEGSDYVFFDIKKLFKIIGEAK